MSKIRILMLDDNPRIHAGDKLPQLSASIPLPYEKILKRNFDLRWMFDFRMSHHFVSYISRSKEEFHRGKRKYFYYPHLWYFDYFLEKENVDIIYNNMKDEAYKKQVLKLLPRCDDTNLFDYTLKREESGFGKGYRDVVGERTGCTVGTNLGREINSYPCVWLPRSVTNVKIEEVSAQQFLNNDTSDAPFDNVSKVYNNWFSLFRDTLPRLRDRLVELFKNNRCYVSINSLRTLTEAVGSEDLDFDALRECEVEITSGRLKESIRAEALFLDQIYDLDKRSSRIDEETPSYQTNQDIRDAISGWVEEASKACVHGQSQSDLSNVISVFNNFRNAFHSDLHRDRKSISASLGDFSSGEPLHSRLNHEVEEKLCQWGIDVAKLKSLSSEKLRKELQKAEIDRREPNTRILYSLKDETENDLQARLVAIALAVYAEQLSIGATTVQRKRACDRIIRKILAPSSDCALPESINELTGVLLDEEKINRAKKVADQAQRGAISSEKFPDELQKAIGEWPARAIAMAFNLDWEYERYNDSDAGSRSQVQRIKALNTYYDLFAPLPKQILLWRQNLKAFENRINQPFKRLVGFRPQQLLNGEVNLVADQSFIGMFADYLNFAQSHWPKWMKP